MVFLTKFDENGNPMTIIMESNYTFEELSSSTELVDYSLKYFGLSLRGARDGSRAVLGNITKYPVLMCERLDLYWFPSKSPRLHECIWFALHHVRSYTAFEKKIQRAYRLRYMLDERTKFAFFLASEPKQRYHFRKQKDGENYEN